MKIPTVDIFKLTGKKWEGIEELGEGGQGTAIKVRSAQARRRRNELVAEIQQAVKQIHGPGDTTPWPQRLADALAEYQKGDDPSSIAALKYFKIPEGAEHSEKAMQRLRREVEALGRVQSPGLLKLLDANPEQRWMVTEYHPGGSLIDRLSAYRGDPLCSLQALRPLAAAVATLHAQPIVHRDIKPQNILVAADGRLVLGDFGIVFFEQGTEDRLTETYERVGTRDWMAPWANTGVRIDEVKPSFDVFPLAKTLWCMVSGQKQLPYWWHRREAYDLQKLFPDQPHMNLVNEILDRCLVDNEAACLPSAKELLDLVDERLAVMSSGADRLSVDVPRPCRVCGKGQYVHWPPDGEQSIDRVIVAVPRSFVDPGVKGIVDQPFHHVGRLSFTVRLFACNACGYIQLFHFPEGQPPAAWRRPQS